MKNIVLFIMLAAAVVTAPLNLRAQEKAAKKPAASETAKPAKKHATPFHGTVTAVDVNAMTVTLSNRVLNVTSETKIMKAGQPAMLADISVGEKITGQFKKNEGGQLDATVIHIGGKAKPAKKEKKKTQE